MLRLRPGRHLLLMDSPAFSGCIVKARIVGIEAEQTEKCIFCIGTRKSISKPRATTVDKRLFANDAGARALVMGKNMSVS